MDALILSLAITTVFLWFFDLLHGWEFQRTIPKPPLANEDHRIRWKTRVYMWMWARASPVLDIVYPFLVIFGPAPSILKWSPTATAALETLRTPPTRVTSRVVLIHGTWRVANYPNQWKLVIAEIAHELPDAEILGFHWMAFNRTDYRLNAAGHLVAKLLSRPRNDLPVVLIGHSHGGTVAFEALRRENCPPQWRAVCLGMPPASPHVNARTLSRGRVFSRLIDHNESHTHLWALAGIFLWLSVLSATVNGIGLDVKDWQKYAVPALIIGWMLHTKLVNPSLKRLKNAQDLAAIRSDQENAAMRDIRPLDRPYMGFHLWGLPRFRAVAKALSRSVLRVAEEDETAHFSSVLPAYQTSSSHVSTELAKMKLERAQRLACLLDVPNCEVKSWIPFNSVIANAYRAEDKVTEAVLNPPATSRRKFDFVPGGLAKTMTAGILLPYNICLVALLGFWIPQTLPVGFLAGFLLACFCWRDKWFGEVRRQLREGLILVRAERSLREELSHTSRLLTESFDSIGWGAHLEMRDVSPSTIPIPGTAKRRSTITLRQHRLSLTDMAVVRALARDARDMLLDVARRAPRRRRRPHISRQHSTDFQSLKNDTAPK